MRLKHNNVIMGEHAQPHREMRRFLKYSAFAQYEEATPSESKNKPDTTKQNNEPKATTKPTLGTQRKC